MAAYAKVPYVTPLEYLEREARAETKSEYYDGVIVAMSGASSQHNRVTINISSHLFTQLTGTSCEPFPSDMRMHVPACNHYYYPDLSVACGGSQFEVLAGVETLENPTLVVEVLSPSTANNDTYDKLLCYQTIPSLMSYLIVAQDRLLVQCYERQPGGSWNYRVYEGLEAVVPLPSIKCSLSLAEIYARVEFPQAGACKLNPE